MNLSLVSCGQKSKKEETKEASTEIKEISESEKRLVIQDLDRVASEIEEEKVILEKIISEEEEKEEKEFVPKDYYSMSKYDPEDKIHYGLVSLAEKTKEGWSTKIIAIIGKDTLDVPYPHKNDPGDLSYSERGDVNGNGYNDIAILSGIIGNCCDPNYTLASFDGKEFRLTETIEWVSEFEIEVLDTYSRVVVERELRSSDVDEQFKDHTVYEYKNYQLEEISKISSKNITADRELTTKNVYDKDYPKSDMYGKEGIAMRYLDNEKDSLRIIALGASYGRGLLEVYLFDDNENQHYAIASEVSRVGILPIEQEGYPLLVINMDEIYTKDGPYKGDIQEIYRQLKAMGRM